MDPNHEKEKPEYTFELADDEQADEAGSVDDFIRELEAKEKDLHITAETTFIELAADFDDPDDLPDFLRQDLAGSTQVAVKPAAAPTADSARVKQLEAEISALKAKIAGMEEQRAELYDNSQRRLKDFESFKARTERERRETFERQLSNLATEMLPALDNLDRALQCASEMADEKQTEFAQFFDGIVLVNQQVHEVLAGMGIVPIATLGHPFDPRLHEAVAIDEESGLPQNTITAELLRGFRIGEKVVRHSMVKVAKGPGPQTNETADTAAGPDEEPEAATSDEIPDMAVERNSEISDQGDDEQ